MINAFKRKYIYAQNNLSDLIVVFAKSQQKTIMKKKRM